MAEKSPKKPKRKQPESGETGVLASLPATRPNRMSSRRRDSGAPASTEKAAAGTRAKPTASKAASAASKALASPPKPAAKAKAKAAAKAKAKPAAKATPITAKPAAQRPRPVRSASKNLTEPAKKSADQRPPAEEKSGQSGTELVTTVVQAAGELAQVGLSVGGQILKRAVEKLPKP